MSKMERIFHGVFAECWPFILDDQATQVRIEQGLTEAFCEPVGALTYGQAEDYGDARAT